MAVDVSYYGTIELKGTRDGIIALLGQMTGGAFAGQKYESGHTLGETTLYHPGAFPYRLIGPVQLLWHDSSTRLWLRIHASIVSETLDALQSAQTNVEVLDISIELSSFELIGPQGGALIRRVFRATDRRNLQHLGDPRLLPRGTVIACTIYDPRLNFPPSPVDDHDTPIDIDGVARINGSLPTSQTKLWESTARLARPKFKKSELDRRRQSISSNRLRPTSHDDRLSLLLVGLGDRYLLLCPPAWSMPILSSIAHTGTLLGGLQERRSGLRELGIPSFPEHYGATCRAGEDWAEARANEDEARWSRKPPGKRISKAIWREDWGRVLGLSEEAKTNGSEIWVWPSELKDHVGNLNVLHAFRAARKMSLRAIDVKTGLVAVKLEMEGRGSPGRLAEIFRVDRDEHVGYTSTGNFSMARGTGFALGHVSLSAWAALEGRVRVKSAEGLYREAFITLI